MDFLTVAQVLGIPTACLVALAVAVWAVLKWCAKYILKPAVDKHLKLVDQLTVKLSIQAGSVERLTMSLEDMSKRVREVHDKVIIHAGSAVITPRSPA